MEMNKVNLLSGSYSPAQAHQMLSKMIKTELQFHRLENFTSLIRYEGNCEQATENIHHLCHAQEEIDRIVKKAREENRYVRLEASLRFSLVEEPIKIHEQVACPTL
jgi:hypothetical protein